MKSSFFVCISNDKYPAALELRKIYEVIPDEISLQKGLLRVIDESGEDYLYPGTMFEPIQVPDNLASTLHRLAS